MEVTSESCVDEPEVEDGGAYVAVGKANIETPRAGFGRNRSILQILFCVGCVRGFRVAYVGIIATNGLCSLFCICSSCVLYVLHVPY